MLGAVVAAEEASEAAGALGAEALEEDEVEVSVVLGAVVAAEEVSEAAGALGAEALEEDEVEVSVVLGAAASVDVVTDVDGALGVEAPLFEGGSETAELIPELLEGGVETLEPAEAPEPETSTGATAITAGACPEAGGSDLTSGIEVSGKLAKSVAEAVSGMSDRSTFSSDWAAGASLIRLKLCSMLGQAASMSEKNQGRMRKAAFISSPKIEATFKARSPKILSEILLRIQVEAAW